MASLPEHSSPGSKTVLCSFGQYSRPVLFTSTSERSDFDSLSEAISGVFGDVIPQSSRQSNVYILKMESPDWGGHLVDIREGDIIPDQSVINVLQRKEAFTRETYEPSSSKAISMCGKVLQCNNSNTSTIARLFKKRKPFEVRPSQYSSTRKPKRITFVLLIDEHQKVVPRGDLRRKMKDDGRILKLAINRSMSPEDVKITLRDAYSSLGMSDVIYMAISHGNALVMHKNQEMDGNQVIELAGQGCIYMLAHSPSSEQGPFTSTIEEKVHDNGKGDCLKEVIILDENDTMNVGNEPCEIEELNSEYNSQSLIVDENQESLFLEDAKIERRIISLRERLNNTNIIVSGGNVAVGLKFGDGRKESLSLSNNSTLKDLYQVAFTKGACPPFTLYSTTPQRTKVPCDEKLHCSSLSGTLLMVQECCKTIDIYNFLDFLEPEQESPLDKKNEGIYDTSICIKELESQRIEFISSLCLKPGFYEVRRSHLYEDLLSIYGMTTVSEEYPVRIKFYGELAVDIGGVSRDMYTGFWEECYKILFDGSNTLVPLLECDSNAFATLGTILSHGYLVCGFLPLRIAKPVLIESLLGPDHNRCNIADSILTESFFNHITLFERQKLDAALCGTMDVDTVMSILSRFGCRKMVTPTNINSLICNAAKYEFIRKPMAVNTLIHSGIPQSHTQFWSNLGIDGICHLINTLSLSVEKVLESFLCFPKSKTEERVYSYLQSMVGNMNEKSLKNFVRFCTGIAVLTADNIGIEFTSDTSFFAHTCTATLELPTHYTTYAEFVKDWKPILYGNDDIWCMDSL